MTFAWEKWEDGVIQTGSVQPIGHADVFTSELHKMFYYYCTSGVGLSSFLTGDDGRPQITDTLGETLYEETLAPLLVHLFK